LPFIFGNIFIRLATVNYGTLQVVIYIILLKIEKYADKSIHIITGWLYAYIPPLMC
jgi:hypothetical protein